MVVKIIKDENFYKTFTSIPVADTGRWYLAKDLL